MSDTAPPADLTWTEQGPRSSVFGDVYFSADDGLAESRAVFLAGCGLPEAWVGRDRFVVGELGFGTGLNIAALLALWDEARTPGARLSVFTIEAHPLSAEDAGRALAAWPELATVTGPLLARWPAGAPGFHRIDLPAFGATIDLAIGDAAWALDQWSGRADAWFLDGFSPSLNPGMWSDEVLDGVAARSAPDARLATFTVAGAVRRGLAARGFEVAKRPGHGRKRERLEAWRTGAAAAQARPRVAVIGAGIAGASAVRGLRALGARPVLVEAEAVGAGGSGFAAALVTPRLDAGDVAIAGLSAQALDRAATLYDAIPGAVTARGVLQLASADRDAARFAKVAAQAIWPDEAMRVVGAGEASARLDEPVEAGGLMMAGARAVRPRAILDAWLEGVQCAPMRVARLEPLEASWRLVGTAGETLETDAVVIAGGWGTEALAPGFGLKPVRGQAEWIEGETGPATAWGGYVAPGDGGVLFGATHDRERTDAAPDDDSAARNRQTLAARLPGLAQTLDRALDRATTSRAAVRATTRDRSPIAGAVSGRAGLFVLSGLGSRGFALAPLLGEHVAALVMGAPSPLPKRLAAVVGPERL
ncbi:FAD-dependent cmnm(5)s(2)U34 oxidoreductase [Brevundimonas sp. Leaf363]|uniref:tRNA (5-methylaminomethyl-2-thiouridine)(34)-methyltransferase MnmD n=1 Tax=Brevundimonas sp. Leaf363 TaxID=1736353 RepID=UPI0006FBDA67|nr:tRNA (5-methylaminomethyl-2-thiouridine)(34)-methyltransferase MnmD [Brevundimonas sp. Leaf363]KQS53664.1 FAD-dependent cmnm(5)s(2)U34 oxidoreductase [Brevundimonas sp. Leaf363]